MTISVDPYDDHGAMAVLSQLDPVDRVEAAILRGSMPSHLQLFAEWRALQASWVFGHVLRTRALTGLPFAVLAVGNTGQAGVAQAAFLARDHVRFRREIVAAAVLARDAIGPTCAQLGIRRIEARCWAGHPTAANFLAAIGFQAEADMAGFGGDGRQIVRQFAYVAELSPHQPDQEQKHVHYPQNADPRGAEDRGL